jgi:hypothetical protein
LVLSSTFANPWKNGKKRKISVISEHKPVLEFLSCTLGINQDVKSKSSSSCHHLVRSIIVAVEVLHQVVTMDLTTTLIRLAVLLEEEVAARWQGPVVPQEDVEMELRASR